MIRSYFLTGWRNLVKQRGYALMKIAGLTFGLAVSMIIYLYIQEDLSFDRFHEKASRIVRVLTIDSAEGVSSKLVGVSQPALAPAVEQEIPEVEIAVRVQNNGRYDLSYGDKVLKCEGAFRTESAFFDVFDFPILEGRREGPLDAPGSIVITETLARKVFGEDNAIGKTVKLNQQIELFVTAVIADPPPNSHLQFDLLRSMTPGENEEGYRNYLQNWQGIGMFTYLLLNKEIPAAELNAKLQAITRKNDAYEFFTPVTQPLTDMHLHSKEILFESNANKSDILNIYVLSAVALMILILAVVNFINLVTARAASRAREVGLRKVIGALRKQLIFQYLSESILVTSISSVLALTLVLALIPFLNTAYGRFADATVLFTPNALLLLVLFILLVGVLAGLYPAFVLSSLKPVTTLKGSFQHTSGGVQLRKALVVLQFTISISLMVGTGIVHQQMQFIYRSDLGYNREQVLTIPQSGAAIQQAQTLRTELLRNPSIVSAGTASAQVGQQLGRTTIYPEGFGDDRSIITSIMNVDENFLPTMGMTMIEGRNFSTDFDDSLSMIVNEEMVRLLKWDDPVGKKISLSSGPQPTDRTAYTVVGIVKDFHFATIRHKLEPMFMLYNAQNPAMAIRVEAGKMPEAIHAIELAWKQINPGTTLEYLFLDEQFGNLYRNEQAFARMFTHFTLLAILIAGLGLFALAAYTTEQRKKEIGIRKVLGASNGTILYNLSSEFVKLVLVAFGLACVISYWVMKQWLMDFSYSITMGPSTFALAGILAVAIALLTVSYQALRAAWSNPVDALRSE